MNIAAAIAAWTGRLSLRAILLRGFAAVLCLTLGLGVVSWLAQARSVAATNRLLDVEVRIAQLSLGGLDLMHNARRTEKDFRLLWREFGYYEARSRYVTLLQSYLADLRERMAEIRRLSSDPQVNEQTRKIEQGTGKYEADVLKATALYEQLGHLNSGLEGRLRSQAHEIESIVGRGGGDRLLADLLMLRRHEKDYLLRSANKYVDAFRDAVARLKADTAASRLPPALKQRVASLADSYHADFEHYAQVDQQIDAVRETYLAAAHEVEPLLEDLHIAANRLASVTRDAVGETARTTAWIIVWASLAAILGGLSMTLFVSGSIARSVRECADFASRIARGELDTRISPSGNNEFTTLARALNAMSDALQTSRALIERRNRLYAALSQTNSAIVRIKDRDALFQEVCRIAVVQGCLKIAYIDLIEANEGRLKLAAHSGSAEDIPGGMLIPLEANLPEGNGPIAVAFRERRAYVCNDLSTDPGTMPWRDHAERAGVRATAAFPLYQGGQAAGVLGLYAESPGFFDADITDLLGEMARDISFALDNIENERERAALKITEEHFHVAAEASLDALFILKSVRGEGGKILDFEIIDINARAGQMLGRAREQIIGQKLCEFIPISRAGGFFDKYVAVVTTGTPLDEEFPIDTPEIKAKWLRQQVVRVDDGIVISARDITAWKEAGRALRESEQHFRLIAETIPDIIYEAKVSDTFAATYVSPALSVLTGFEPVEFVDHPDVWAKQLHEQDRERVLTEVQSALDGGAAGYTIEYRFWHKDGTTLLWFEDHAKVNYDGQGKPLRICGVMADITERKRTQQELDARAQQLARSNEELARFNRLATGRELRMIEMKQEVNDLAAEFGRPRPYALAFVDPAAAGIVRSTPRPTEVPSASEPSQTLNEKEPSP